MPLTILVSGLLEYDSGKTWLSISLGLLAKRRGLRTVIYKPVAGHNVWNKYGAIIESKKRRVLVGNDVLEYEKYLGSEIRVELINPIDMLLAYPDPTLFHGSGQYMLTLSSLDRLVVLSRVTSCNSRVSVSHFVFTENVDKLSGVVKDDVVELARTLGAVPVSVNEFFEFLSSNRASDLLEACRESVARGRDIVIVESFSDSLLPYSGLEEAVDTFVLVSPGKAFVFTGEKLRQALELLGERGMRAVNMLDMARYSAIAVVDVPLAESPLKLSEKLEKTELAKIIA